MSHIGFFSATCNRVPPLVARLHVAYNGQSNELRILIMILVIGGAGFIGSNLVATLSERGDQPVAVCDRLGIDDKWRNISKHLIADFVLPEAMFSWLDAAANEIQAIIHLGALSSTMESDADSVINNNFLLSLAVWHWCSKHDTRLIYASSAATYGNGSAGFDDDPKGLASLQPLNLYGWSKHLFDRNVIRLADHHPHPPQWVGLKFFNAFGPNEYHKYGQQSVVAQLYEQISDTGTARLFTSHHPDYESGGQMRDFIWVGDCVDVMLWVYDNPQVSGIYNCGTGTARSFNDLARACFTAMERPEKIKFFDMPAVIKDKYQYFTEAKTVRLRGAGYQKPFTTLEDGIMSYITDYLATDDRYR